MSNSYHRAIRLLASIEQRRLRTIIVGANDGKINDPIYELTLQFPSLFSVIAIEPLSSIHPVIKHNYSHIKDFEVFPALVGPPDLCTLYSIAEEYWYLYQPPYASGWPLYRAPTGISSAYRSEVEKHLSKFLGPSFEYIIQEIPVQSSSLLDILKVFNSPQAIDILQIDAEGSDLAVLKAAALEVTMPKIIYIEIKSFSQVEYFELCKILN